MLEKTSNKYSKSDRNCNWYKNPNNITEHIMENKNLSWEQAQKKCQNNKKILASKSELLGFIQEKDNGNSWTPVSDGINNWLQIGTRMSKNNLTDPNPTVVDYGLLHQEIEDSKRYTGSKLPSWGMNTTSWPWKKNIIVVERMRSQNKKWENVLKIVLNQPKLLVIVKKVIQLKQLLMVKLNIIKVAVINALVLRIVVIKI